MNMLYRISSHIDPPEFEYAFWRDDERIDDWYCSRSCADADVCSTEEIDEIVYTPDSSVKMYWAYYGRLIVVPRNLNEEGEE